MKPGDIDLRIDVDLVSQDALQAIHESARQILEMIRPENEGDEVSVFRDGIWPSLGRYDTICNLSTELVLVPLNRIGSNQGWSGSYVLIGYFANANAVDGTHMYPSRPMIIKVAKADPTNDKLAEEHERSKKFSTCVVERRERFAFPVTFYKSSDTNGFNVLWSPFTMSASLIRSLTTIASGEPGNPSMIRIELASAQDFFRQIQDGDDPKKVEESLTQIFELLAQNHRYMRDLCVKKVQIVDEYRDYLRGIENTGSQWPKDWIETWGEASEPKTTDLGKGWTNPLWLLSQLEGLSKWPLSCGAIHGDLHPRNVVFSDGGEPTIIDFGWASDSAHIMKDFVLLECNLRFVLLRHAVSFEDMSMFARWLGEGARHPRLSSNYMKSRVDLIDHLRQLARRQMCEFSTKLDFDKEYIVPLFLVALGLMRWSSDFDNQISSRLTVLALADHISSRLDDWRVAT